MTRPNDANVRKKLVIMPADALVSNFNRGLSGCRAVIFLPFLINNAQLNIVINHAQNQAVAFLWV